MREWCKEENVSYEDLVRMKCRLVGYPDDLDRIGGLIGEWVDRRYAGR